jgi:hypothetical protein
MRIPEALAHPHLSVVQEHLNTDSGRLERVFRSTLYGVQLVVLLLAGGALLPVIWLLWSSVQALAGESELTATGHELSG